MSDVKVTLKKITKKNIEDAYKYVEDYNKEENQYAPCAYDKERLDKLVNDKNILLYGSYVDGRMVAISGVTIDLDVCIDYIYSAHLNEQNNLRFTKFSILPSMAGNGILRTSSYKLIDYVKSMECDNLLAVCTLDDIAGVSVATKIGMEMVENYDNNNRKIFIMRFPKED